MPKQLKIKDVEAIKAQAKELFSKEEEARFVHRLDIIILVTEGLPIRKVAVLYKMNPSTIQRWIHRLNEEGFPGLRDKPGRGRVPRLSSKEREQLRKDLESRPQSFGYQQSRWDGKLLSFHLQHKYRIELKVRRCQFLFRELGFSLQRPRKMPVGADAEEREAFKKNFRNF